MAGHMFKAFQDSNADFHDAKLGQPESMGGSKLSIVDGLPQRRTSERGAPRPRFSQQATPKVTLLGGHDTARSPSDSRNSQVMKSQAPGTHFAKFPARGGPRLKASSKSVVTRPRH